MTVDLTEVRKRLEVEDFAFIPGMIPDDVLKDAARTADAIVASPDESVSEGIHLWHYPFNVSSLDHIFESTGLLGLAEQLLGTDKLLLSNCMLWVKRAEDANSFDERFHRDYTDNALVAQTGFSDSIGFIIYLSDIELEDGPTYYVPREASVGLPVYPRQVALDEGEFERLSELSEPLTGPAGSVLIQSLFGVHRASKPSRNGKRISLHVVLKRADAHWLGWSAWPRHADSERFRSAIPNLSAKSRALLGWPDETWSGWGTDNVDRVLNERYGMAAD